MFAFLSFSRHNLVISILNIVGWSYPIQVPVESASKRLCLSVPNPDTRSTTSYCLNTHIVNGVTYLVLGDTHTPQLILHNECSFPLVYGQTLTTKSEDVLEAMSLLSEPPRVQSGHSVNWRFPTVNRCFPTYVPQSDYPKLKLSGIMLLNKILSSRSSPYFYWRRYSEKLI